MKFLGGTNLKIHTRLTPDGARKRLCHAIQPTYRAVRRTSNWIFEGKAEGTRFQIKCQPLARGNTNLFSQAFSPSTLVEELLSRIKGTTIFHGEVVCTEEGCVVQGSFGLSSGMQYTLAFILTSALILLPIAQSSDAVTAVSIVTLFTIGCQLLIDTHPSQATEEFLTGLFEDVQIVDA